MMNGHRVKLKERAEKVDNSYDRVHCILYLDMRKLGVGWILRLLTINQKQVRMIISQQWLHVLKRNEKIRCDIL